MMVKVVLESISKTVRQNITNQEEVITVDTIPVLSVNFILKRIINKTIIDTRATSVAFRSDLRHVDTFMASYN